MVQRNLPDKYGIQADDHLEDGKTRGPLDLSKKMKKSKSIKLTDNQLPSSIKTMAAPQSHAEKKQPSVCGSSPNYMKPTTSSDARKEKKLQHLTSVSGGKLPRILTRTSSFKMARKLTKTPSFKSKGAKTQTSRVVLSTDMDVRRATCSSTMKDSKFPTYLTLNPGGTMVEGTSVLKVCPYTYCSLNGHHKCPLPPLKCFLKARRCSIKTQKSSNFDVPSLSGRKLHDNELIETEDMGRNKDALCSETNFFIEIYVANKDDEIETAKRCSPDEIEELGREFQIQNLYSIGSGDVKGTEGDFDNKGGQYFDKEVAESFSCGLPSLQIKLEPHQDKCDDKVSIERDIDEEIRVEDPGISNESDSEKKYRVSNEDDERHSEMEWEEGDISLVQLDTEGSCAVTTSNKSDSNNQQPQSEEKQTDFYKESTIMSGQSVRMSNEEMEAEETLQDESISIDMQSDDYSDYALHQKWEILELFPTEETCKETLAMEEQVEENERDLISSVVKSTQKEKIADKTMDATAEVEENIDTQTEVEVLDKTCDTKVTAEVLHKQQEDESCKDDGIVSEGSNKIDPNPEQEVSVSESGFGMEDESETDDDSILMQRISDETPGPNAYSQCNIADFNVDMLLEEDTGEQNGKISSTTGFNERVDSEIKTDDEPRDDSTKLTKAEIESTENSTKDSIKSRLKSLYTRNKTSEEHPDASNNIKWTIRSKGHIDELDEEGRFNPRGPNFLPEVPEPEEEKVDLKHQMMDDKRNTEEWMLDFALQQAVTKLGPARKRKVALLVEAFETVIPVPKYESPMSYISPAFAPTRSIQACN